MSKEYEGQDPLDIAKQAERDLNSLGAKTGARNASDSGMCFDADRDQERTTLPLALF